MSSPSPRKFAEKIALLQQKQAEGDAAFNTIIDEVDAAKKKADRVTSTKNKLDISARKYEVSNGINNSASNNLANQSMKMENNNGFDRLLLPPDNSSWRRTHSDSYLHQAMMPSVIAQYQAQQDNENNNDQLNFDMNDIKFESPQYGMQQHSYHLQVSNTQFQPHNYFDFNNNNYANGRGNVVYPSVHAPMQQQTIAPPQTNTNHTLLGPRYSGGSNNSNVLMLPPNQNSRGSGGSLPDLRTGSVYNNQQLSFSTDPSPPTSASPHLYRSSSPQQSSDGDFYVLGPQRQLPSSIGPLKQSPSIRRRHSPIGEVKQSSPRRQNSPSPDVSSTQQTCYRVEPQSPQSQSSYSPQNSPHLLPSPCNELAPFSPQQQSTDNQQPYFTLPNHFDQITLDHNFYTHQQPTAPLSQQQHNHSLPPTSNDPRQRSYYPPYLDDIPSSYGHNQTSVNLTNHVGQKSPTIPNIILTDADSSKLDLSKELGNDFSTSFDSLINSNGLELTTDDFLLNAADLSLDPIICDDTFSMER